MTEEYEQASPDQKLAIASYFVNSAPTGEVGEVIKDVKVLVNDPKTLNDEKLRSIMQQYNTQQLVSAPAPNSGDEVIVSAFGQVDASHYLNPATGKVLKFDHLSQTFTSETDQKQVLSASIDAYRSAIEAGMKAYVEAGYRAKKCAVAVYGSDDGLIHTCLSAKNVRLSSYWTGGIRATYKLNVSQKGHAELTGSIKVNVHYFEDGNVQLHTDLNKTAKVDIADPSTTAKLVVAAIDKIESDFQNHLEELYISMHTQTFKALRRFLPISGQPVKWESHVHSLASEITK